jgi:hypothetical protein
MFAVLPSDGKPALSVYSTVSSGAQNGVKISLIGSRNTLLLTLTLVSFPPLAHKVSLSGW